MAVDGNGNVYLTDTDGFVLKYGPSGGTPVTIGATGPGALIGPTGVAVDSSGDVYVVDSGQHVKKFHSSDGGATYADVADWTNSGTGTFVNLSGVAVEPSGNIFVVDQSTSQVTELSAAGTPTFWWGTVGAGDSSFRTPYDIAVSPGGAVYVADAGISAPSAVNHRVMRYARDAAAPVTTATVTPSAWTNAASVSVSLSASDPTVFDQYRSGLATPSPTQVSLNGGSTWQDYAGPISVTTEGQTSILYRSSDAVGNVETPKTAVARIDRTAPTTSVSGIPSGWSKTAVTATLSASDPLSGAASTEYSLNGGATWVTGTRPAISAQGITTLLYRSRDTVGNLEAAKTATVRIDGVRPVTKAFAKVTVTRGKTATLRYRVSDVPGAQAKVTIKIYNAAGKLRATWKVGLVTTGHTLTYSHRCMLAKGTYTWKVYATDLAGNVQVTPAGKKLIVT